MPCSLSLSLARTRAAPVVAGLRQILCGAAACLELKATARVLRAEDRLSVAFLSDTLPAEWMHEAPPNRAFVDPTDGIPTATARPHPARASAPGRRLLASGDAAAAGPGRSIVDSEKIRGNRDGLSVAPTTNRHRRQKQKSKTAFPYRQFDLFN